MLERFRQAILSLTVRADAMKTHDDVRRLVSAGAVEARNGTLLERIEGIAGVAQMHADEVASWTSASDFEDGAGGPFDSCDLRHWLVLAQSAGVPSVPAREILVLDEEEMSALSGTVAMPKSATMRRFAQGLRSIAVDISPPDETRVDMEALVERTFAAMDDIPEGWMVRSNRCGSSELKALAGVGAAGSTVPEVRFGSDLEVGPGWVRNGNRRRVNTADHRTIEMSAQGPGGAAFLARPWVPASRWFVGEDPHRHGTPFAGKGQWPAEWRAFARNGRVSGVAAYYGWLGEASPENAAIAMEVRDLAQRIVDEAAARQAWPRYPDIELVRGGRAASHPETAEILDMFGREDVSCTLDFIETENGLLLLEGGPACTPFGGGHPCAFAGAGRKAQGDMMDIEGVAFVLMPGIVMADPRTWIETDRTDCILSWGDVAELAHGKSLAPGF
jgi:hypothetical protein